MGIEIDVDMDISRGSEIWATLNTKWSTLGYSGLVFPATWLPR